MNCGYERELRWHEWHGLRALELTALPAAISPRLNYELLSDCLYQKISLEICMLSQNEKLRIFMLLRAADFSQSTLVKQLEEALNRLEALLADAGFLAVRADLAKDNLYALLLPCTGRQSAMYFAPETGKAYYAPADLTQLMPLDWTAIARALGRSAHAVFSVHLMPASFSAEEKHVISQNCAFFEQENIQRPSDEAAQCVQAYRKLQELSAENVFFMALIMHGDEEAENETAGIMHRTGLIRRQLNARHAAMLDELLTEPLLLAENLTSAGHTCAHALPAVMSRLSHLISREAGAAFSSFPNAAARMPGVRINTKPVNNQPLPDELLDKAGLLIGSIPERGQEIHLPPDWLPLHGAIFGMPGMGKTTYAIGLMNQLWEKGYPFLIIEPTKTEYRTMIDCIPDLRIYTAGRSDVSPMSLNPFIPPKGVTLEQFKPSLISVFMAAFSMTSPLDVIFPDVVNECYTRYGWRSSSTRDSKGVQIFGLHEFICVFRESIRRSHYDNESKANIESGGAYRLQALINSNPTLYDSDHSLPFDTLLEHPTLIELDAIDNPEQKCLIMSMILINLMLVIRSKQICDGRLKNVIMVDEAHLLLGQHMGGANEESAKSSQSAVQLLQNLVVTIRAYGTGLIFADQSPQKLTAEVVSNCSFKTIFHLDSAPDRSLLAQSTGLTEKMVEDIRTLEPGEAYIGCSKLNRPIRVRTPHVRKLLGLRARVSEEELRARTEHTAPPRPFAACSGCAACSSGCSIACRTEGEFLAQSICLRAASALHDPEGLKTLQTNMSALVAGAIASLSGDTEDKQRLSECTRIQLVRRIRLISHADTSTLK